MSSYCIQCGAHLTRGRFCPDCGAAAVAEPPWTDTAHEQPTVAAPGSRERFQRRPMALAATALVLLAVLALGSLAVRAQIQTTAAHDAERIAAQDAARTAAEDARKAEAAARAERQRLRRKERARTRVEARAREQQSPPSVVVVPAPGPPYSGPVDGEWTGSMDDGRYSFRLSLSDYEGYLAGEMYQQNTATGEDGTEIVEGYREGNVLYLRGTSWRHAPSGWSLDVLALSVATDGRSLAGTYTCAACEPSNTISGWRR